MMKIQSLAILSCMLLLHSACFAKTINVKKMGAKADGKTDDTKAIQAAINEASKTSGNTVYFPKGIYLVGSYTVTKNYLENYCLLLHSNIIFKGDGAISVIRLAGHLFDKTDSNANAHLFYGTEVNNIKFTSMLIDMNGKNNLVPEGIVKNPSALLIKRGSGITLQNVTVKNSAGRNMIILTGTGSRALIERNTFLNGGNYVGSSTPNKYQVDFSFVYCEWDSSRIINNRIEQQRPGIALNGISGGIEMHGSYSYTGGNTIIGCSPGLYISSTRKETKRSTAENNRFINCQRGISFWVNYPMDSITIRNNKIQLTYSRQRKYYMLCGIEMPNGNTSVYDFKHANGDSVNHLLIEGNIISAIYENKSMPDRTAGIVLHSVYNSVIQNNTINAMNMGGIIVQGSKWGTADVEIKNNKFSNFLPNYDPVSPGGYVVVFDSYLQKEKGAKGIKNINVSNNAFMRTSKKTNKPVPGGGAKQAGRFYGILVALPETMQKEVRFKNNTFSDTTEGINIIKTNKNSE